MDDSLTELERELRLLRPARPSVKTASEISRQLDVPRARFFTKLAWLGLPIAAAIGVLIFSLQRSDFTSTEPSSVGSKVAASPATFQVVGSESVLLSAKDEGITALPDGTPARRLRETYLATVVWKDPQTQASLKWTIPREEFRIVPVSLQ